MHCCYECVFERAIPHTFTLIACGANVRGAGFNRWALACQHFQKKKKEEVIEMPTR